MIFIFIEFVWCYTKEEYFGQEANKKRSSAIRMQEITDGRSRYQR